MGFWTTVGAIVVGGIILAVLGTAGGLALGAINTRGAVR